jgi:hypothetical protein
VLDRSIRSGWIAIVAGLLVCVGSAQARQQQELHPLVSKLDPAWRRLAESNAKFLTMDQQRLLDDLAFAMAVSGGCPGFQLDHDKFKKAFDGFRNDDYMKLPADQKRQREYHLMMNFGATVALYTAEGLLHPKAACKFAEGKRGEGPGQYWLPTSGPPAR